jgi:4-amino-4-deoxy-L-arabinose transferase-like glycosyltransferase
MERTPPAHPGWRARFERWSAILRSPLAWIVLVACTIRLVGIGWGLPSSDGWDDDGVAPRDFLVGVVKTYTPGDFYTYPPVHLLILAVLNAPAVVIGVARAASTAPADLVHEFIQVPYMTTFAIVARLVSCAMSLGIVVAVARTAEEIAGRRAGLFAAAVVALNAPLTYYAHTTNLDVPYLFWATHAIHRLTRAIARRELRELRWAAALGALAVGTKDQAYALFLLSAPVALGAWLALDAWPRKNARAVGLEVLRAVAIAIAILLVVDGALVNPSGFRARVAFLVGTASQDHAYFTADAAGRYAILREIAYSFERHYPAILGLFVASGLVVALRRGPSAAAALVPILCAVSFTVTFNFTARRTEDRFVLPQMILLAVYAGIALDALFAVRLRGLSPRAARWIAAVAVLPIAARALYLCAGVDALLLLDPRYEVERFLAANVAPGDVIEVYGNNVYFPRFPAGAQVVRVGTSPPDTRNPVLGMTEVEEHYSLVEHRKPRWIVVCAAWAWRYMPPPEHERWPGHVPSPLGAEWRKDQAATDYFQRLDRDELAYVHAFVGRWTSAFWPAVSFHASTAREVTVFKRRD